MSFFWGHWYPCFGFLVMSPLGFKARVGSALFTIFAEANVMYIPQNSPQVLHLPTSWRLVRSRSLPHMHVQRWDLARFRTCYRMNRRRSQSGFFNPRGDIIRNLNSRTSGPKIEIHVFAKNFFKKDYKFGYGKCCDTCH